MTAARLPSTVLSEPGHLILPAVEPTMLAAESATPTEITPEKSTRGEGWTERGP